MRNQIDYYDPEPYKPTGFKTNMGDFFQFVKHIFGPFLQHLSSPVSKRFQNKGGSSPKSSVLSEYLGNNLKRRINLKGTKRLYTHTLFGKARYATTWGRYFGRWGTRIFGPLGLGLTAFDITSMLYEYRSEIKQGLEIRHEYLSNGQIPFR